MRELDHGVDAGRVLDDYAVAERPVFAAAVARAGCPDQSAPDDDGYEVGQHAPGKAAEGRRWEAIYMGGSGSGRHDHVLRNGPFSLDQTAEKLRRTD